MTVVAARRAPGSDSPVTGPSAGHRLVPTAAALASIAALQAVLAWRPGLNPNAFQDEGLYLDLGHRMVHHLATGATLPDNPGAYVSGAPGFYPILAATADAVGGLVAARGLSLALAMGAMLAVYAIGREVFGRPAGLLGASAFAVCGSVVFQSQLATYDAMVLLLIAAAAALAVRSATRDQLAWWPLVALLLVAAFFAKYASAVYVPGIAALAVAVGWPTGHRWTILVRAIVMAASAGVVVWFVLEFWGASIVPGIVMTTADRVVLAPTAPVDLATSVLGWVGPWLLLAAAAVPLSGARWPTAAALLVVGLVAAAQQIRIGEATSLSKHLAFGMVFLAPLVGLTIARLGALRPHRIAAGLPCAVAVLLVLAGWGARASADHLTGWVDDRDLLPVLAADLTREPGKAILGEEPAAQRYVLRDSTAPDQWVDTFAFYYDGLEGMPAYRRAIDQSHFGVIYLSLATANGRAINEYLTTADTPYRLSAKAPARLRGQVVGDWLIWTPTVLGR